MSERGRESPDAESLLTDVANGQARLVSIQGGPGSGKSTTLLDLDRAIAARTDLVVLRARCSPDEFDFRLGVVRQLLTPLVGQSELDSRLTGTGVGRPFGHDVLHHLFGILAEVTGARTPIITVDDAQWADEDSARFLAYLARRMHQRAMLLVFAHDPQEPSPHGALLAQLAGDPAAVVWAMVALRHPEVAAACGQRLGPTDPTVVELCRELTHGVPFLLTELLAQAERVMDRTGEPARSVLLDCAPMNVATMTLTRVRRHGAHLPAVLGALSVLREPVTLHQAAEITGVGLAELEDALAILERLGVVTVDPSVAVVPPLVRRAVSQALHPSERHDAEARAATTLAGDDRTREAAARHLVETHPAGNAAHVEILRRAAAEALERGSVEAAAMFLQRALAEPPPVEVLVNVRAELGAVQLRYDAGSAVSQLRSAHLATAEPAIRAQRALALAYGLMLVDRSAEAAGVLAAELGAGALDPGHPLLDRMRAELVLARLGDDDQDRPLAFAPSPATSDGSDRVGRQSLAVAALLGAFACRPVADVVRDAQLALGGDIAPGEDGSIALLAASAVLIWGDELTGADHFLVQFAQECARRGEVLGATVAGGLRGLVASRRGDLITATAQLAAAASLVARGPGRPEHGLASLALTLELAVESEEPDAVLLCANLVAELPRRWLGAIALAGRGRVRVLAGDVRRGLVDLTEAGRRLERIGCRNPAIVPWRSAAAQAYVLLGQPGEALALVETEVELARAFGARRALAVALRQRGQVRRGNDDPTDLDEALALLGPDGFPLERARTLLARGRTHRAQRQPQAARVALTEAYDLATLSGAERLAERVREELLASGGRPRVRKRPDGSVLTVGEERIARMAVDGLTNEEIAGQLFLARRTVESHLTSAYRKLNIRGRAQLAAALYRAGQPTGATAPPNPRRTMLGLRADPNQPEQPDSNLAG